METIFAMARGRGTFTGLPFTVIALTHSDVMLKKPSLIDGPLM